MANTKKKIVDVLNLTRIQKSLLSGKKHFSGDEMKVPVDVKEGHFAVMAVDDDQLGRFIVPLSFLTHPSSCGYWSKLPKNTASITAAPSPFPAVPPSCSGYWQRTHLLTGPSLQ
ncbi:auxin-induced protein X15-like [Salvia divinorum]|uniref:Auxin-induced protein X15-like n=1 Tax=Salvia divinorum TaxID=28513 RepID=A0ABD1GK78_SALDI